MKVKLDENLGNRAAIELFRDAGHDVATVSEQDLGGTSDDGLIEVCRTEGRVLVTLDLELGVKPGDEIILHLDEEGLRLYTPAQAVARAQTLVRRYVPEERSLAEELISERREEAALI